MSDVPPVIRIAGGLFLTYSGVALLVGGVRAIAGGSKPFGRLGPGALEGGALQAAGFTLPGDIKSKLVQVKSLDERVDLMRGLIKKGGLDPQVHMLAGKVLSRKCSGTWCVAEKDWEGEAKALFNYVRQNLRYMRDPKRADGFKAPKHSLFMRAGDCDDGAILLGSLLEAAGHTVKLRVVHTEGFRDWNHVYLLVGLPPGKTARWMALDTSVPKPAGWEVGKASEVESTGRPAGIVLRSRTFDV